jgi:hypothetical protein
MSTLTIRLPAQESSGGYDPRQARGANGSLDDHSDDARVDKMLLPRRQANSA